MEKKELNKILDDHRKWLSDDPTGKRADLRNAELSNANLDFACWVLSCKSLSCKIDDKIFNQLLYHTLKICPVDNPIRKTDAWKLFVYEANKFHRTVECGEIV